MTRNGPTSTHDLLPSERAFIGAMSRLGFGRFEYIRIEHGEIVLDPWPAVVREVKFGSQDPGVLKPLSAEFELKQQVVEFLDYVRSAHAGEIRVLEVQHGVPFSMELELAGPSSARRPRE